MTDPKSPNGPPQDGNRPKSRPGYHKPHVRDPETGVTLTKNGNYHASSGTGAIVKKKIIPPVDMQSLVERGITPTLYTNWDHEDPESNWHLSYRKFTPERKAIYLTQLEQHGVQAVAARWAGVSSGCIRQHRKDDPHFDEACNEAEEYYHAMCAASILNQARVGMIDEKYDREGNVISRRVSYETRIREIMLKRARPDYNDVQKQEVSVVGGAVVVPAPIDSVESWEDVVKRHTGGGSGALAGGDVGKLPSAEGSSAMAEGRVVKRTSVNGVQRTLIDGERSELPVVETEGESVVNKEPGSDSERIE